MLISARPLSPLSPLSGLTEHQLFDVFNNAIVSFYRSEDEGGGEDGGGGGGAGGGSSSGGGGAGGNTGSDSSSRNDRGSSSSSSNSSGGGATNSDSGIGTTGGGGGGAGSTGDSGNTNNAPAGNGGVGPAVVPVAMTTNDALLFHEKCGTLIKLSNNNKTAERRRPLDEFNNGVVMTNRPLRHNEMFEVSDLFYFKHLGYFKNDCAGFSEALTSLCTEQTVWSTIW